jgi:hypothetical protein
MVMTPRLRKLVLTAHVTFSVGWLGAVAAFLALAASGLACQDAQRVRADYLAMALIGTLDLQATRHDAARSARATREVGVGCGRRGSARIVAPLPDQRFDRGPHVVIVAQRQALRRGGRAPPRGNARTRGRVVRMDVTPVIVRLLVMTTITSPAVVRIGAPAPWGRAQRADLRW